ncbi:MAG: preQ(1) synthase [Planctomycetota bacterium]
MSDLTDAERNEAVRSRGDAGLDDPGVAEAAANLVTFDNAYPQRDYVIQITAPEFTAVCPVTDQPDFGSMEIAYVPDLKILELKSLKLYLGAFRNVGIFHETVTNKILEDLREALQPRHIQITGHYNARGGITTTVTAEWPERDPGIPGS